MLAPARGPGLMAIKRDQAQKNCETETRGRRSARRGGAARPGSATDVALASLAHEIRTPLTGILALAELLHASDLPEREQRWAEAIRGAADHLARLTSLVVDSAKADSAGFALREEVFSPRDLARSVAGLLAARAESKGLEVDPRSRPACRPGSSATWCGCAARWRT